MRLKTVIPVVLIIATLAGCLGGPSDPSPAEEPAAGLVGPADWAERAVPSDPEHHHDDPAQHRGLSSANFELLGWDPLARSGSMTMGGGGCGAVNSGGDRKLAAVAATWDDGQGLAIADVTDPMDPHKVGELSSPQFWFRDAEITPDGRWAVVASFPTRANGVGLPHGARASTPCPDSVPPAAMAAFGGVALVDLSDPTQPVVADFAADAAGGPHSVYANTVDGVTYVMSANNGVPSDASRFMFYTVEDGALSPYGVHTLQAPRASAAQPLFNLHTDSWIQKHPVTGQVLAYIANWDSGLVLLELQGPGLIVPVGAWNDYDPSLGSEMTGQIHSVAVTPELWDGKHYTFAGQEIIARPKDRPTGQMVMLDTTDPTQPVPVARWTLPVDTGIWDNKVTWCCLFSTHYVTLVGHTMFISMYHGGVWAIDVTPGAGPELPSLGAFIPSPPDPAYVSPAPGSPAPFVEEVYALDNGDLVTFDDYGGLYTFRFHPEIPVALPPPWTQDAWLK